MYRLVVAPSENRIGKEVFETLGICILNHRPAECHHQRHRRVDFRIRPPLRWIQVAASVGGGERRRRQRIVRWLASPEEVEIRRVALCVAPV